MRLAGLIALLPLLTGCAITLNLPVNRFESPETAGRNEIFLEAGVQGVSKAVLVPNTTASPPDVSSPIFQRVNATPVLGLGLGLLSRVDLAVRAQVNTPSLLKAKLQLLGSPANRAEPGNFSLSLSGGIGLGRKSEQDAGLFNSVEAMSDVDFVTYDAAVILGYRFSRSLLLYGSAYRTSISVDGKITQTSPGAKAKFHGFAIQDGGALGLEMRSRIIGGMLELGYGSASYKSASDDGLFVGAMVKIFGDWGD